MPQEHQKMKISKLDKQEHEEDLKLPEVSTETFETVKADLVDVDMKANSCDKDIEKRLTKLHNGMEMSSRQIRTPPRRLWA